MAISPITAKGTYDTKGVGRHTAYGYGMLLLRPAGGQNKEQGE